MNKTLVKEEFGANATHYVDSKPHAKGASLARLVELVKPQSHWKALDIATAAGHTALVFAPHVAHVTATDITPEMLPLATNLAAERGIKNLTAEIADAEDLPYDDASFDLVTCRIAPHHFPNVGRFIAESARVLRSEGILAVVDNVVPDGEVGVYVNAFEKLRDPSHGRCLSLQEWLDGFEEAGLAIQHSETLEKPMEFDSWASRHDEAMQQRLRNLLLEAPNDVAAFLQPKTVDGKLMFRLEEGVIIGQRA